MNSPSTVADFTLHYKCQFTLSCSSDGEIQPDRIWMKVTYLIYEWVKQRVTTFKEEEFIGLNAFRRSSPTGLAKFQNGTRTSTRVSSESFPADLWTCQFEHPEHENSHRRWRVDIGLIHQADAGVQVAIRVFHGVVAAYIGSELLSPQVSAPRIVLQLLNSNEWSACLGSLSLRTISSTPDSGKQLWNQLRNPDRRGPIVVLAANADGQYPIDPKIISRQLSGVAAVWLLPYEFQNEFASPYYAGPTHYCQPGTIRIYQPNLKPTNEVDGRRHRYLLSSFIKEQGREAVLVIIVKALIRQANFINTLAIFSPDELEQHQRAERIEQLRQQVAASSIREQLSTEASEYIKALEEDNQKLNSDLKNAASDAHESGMQILEQNELLEEQLRQLSSKLQMLEADNLRVKEKSTSETDERLANLLRQTTVFPKTVEEAASLAEQCWIEQLIFTPRAKKSIKDTAFDDPAMLWQTLWHMAHTLHPLYFGDTSLPPKVVEQLFADTAPNLSLTHNETKTTRNNSELMKLRQEEYNGQSLDIEPHVKYGNKSPKLLRVYFHRDTDNKRLIIGHCGDHLPTHGSLYQ